jgi:hypothetical protein
MAKPDGGSLVAELEQTERTVRERLSRRAEEALAGGQFMPPTGVPLIDYAMDQVRFFREAWSLHKEQGLTDLATLERVELLSLPECLRRVRRRRWSRATLMEYALSGEWTCWQSILELKKPSKDLPVMPRVRGWPCGLRLLGPYPSSTRLRAGPLINLEAEVSLDPTERRDALHPIRPLSVAEGQPQSPFKWTLCMSIWHRRRGKPPLRIRIDPPWGFSLEGAQITLRELADRLGATADGATSAPEPPPDPVIQYWKQLAEGLRSVAERLPELRPGRRAALFERCYEIVGTFDLVPVTFVTDDMPSDLLAQSIGFSLKTGGLLSVREVRTVGRAVEDRLRRDYPDTSPSELRQLHRGLEGLRRPLRHASVRAYERQVLNYLRNRRARRRTLREPLERLSRRLGMHPRTAYRRFKRFLRERGLRRTYRSFRLFSRHLRRQRRTRQGD